MFKDALKKWLVLAALVTSPLTLFGDNQTPDVSTIHSGDELPFSISIKQADFELPNGFHSGVSATYKGKWLLFAGRTNGLHGFDGNNDNFPPQEQNPYVYVVDPKRGTVKKRSILCSGSGLAQHQIDSLTVTSPQYYQDGETLYITGGYGVDSATGLFNTKPLLSAVNIPGIIHWVTHLDSDQTFAQHLRQVSDPIFQVTGGAMAQLDDHSTLLIFGQNFDGYYVPGSDGKYTQVVRRFKIIDDGKILFFKIKESKPEVADPNYRRRDLNVVPSIKLHKGKSTRYLVALSGVFTLTDGVWTVPVTISPTGRPSMDNPNDERTFKQGMNNYISATAGLFSKEKRDMYTILLGGISFGYFNGNSFQTDSEFPFINQITAIKQNHKGNFKQYLLKNEYPVIPSTGSNPGNPLLFGAGAEFFPAEEIKTYSNGVIKLDKIKKKHVLIGYIVGGIQSTLPNTASITDSTASPYIFKVYLKR